MAQSDICLGDICLRLKSRCPLTIYLCPTTQTWQLSIPAKSWSKVSLPSHSNSLEKPRDLVTASRQRGAGTNTQSSSNLLNHRSCFSSKHPTVPLEAAQRRRCWKGRGCQMLGEPSYAPPLPQPKPLCCDPLPLVSEPPPALQSLFPCKYQKDHQVLKAWLNFSCCFYLPLRGNAVDMACFPAVFREDWPGQAQL